jgi:hypothetical protein
MGEIAPRAGYLERIRTGVARVGWMELTEYERD